MAFSYPSLILVDASLATNLVNVGFNSGSVVSPHTIENFRKDTAIVIFCSTVTFFVVIRNTTKFVRNSFSHSLAKSFQRLPRLKSALHVATCQLYLRGVYMARHTDCDAHHVYKGTRNEAHMSPSQGSQGAIHKNEFVVRNTTEPHR